MYFFSSPVELLIPALQHIQQAVHFGEVNLRKARIMPGDILAIIHQVGQLDRLGTL